MLRLSLALVICTLVPTAGHATSARMATVPNGSAIGCNLCHTAGGGTPRNAFALLFQGGNWAGACPQDTDGDGYTNGEEMGDTDCNGAANRTVGITHPSNLNLTPC